MRRVVVFGAGAVGRGFIGEIFSDAGWQVVFVDAADDLVAALQAGSYPHETVTSVSSRRKLVLNCTAIHVRDTQAVVAAVAGADVIFTCVGAANLPAVATDLAVGLRHRHQVGGGPIDVFLAENLHHADDVMRRLLESQPGGSRLDAVGLVKTSIGRMIPVPTQEHRQEHPALVAVEPFRELPCDLSACRASIPDVPDLTGSRDVSFDYYADRKLYLHNMGHCVTAYAGVLGGYNEIAPAISDLQIRALVVMAMEAMAHALASEYRQPVEEVVAHARDLIRRFGNAGLHDTVERVGRDPERKLQPGDRFLGALEMASRHGRGQELVAPVALGAWYLSQSTDDSTIAEVERFIAEQEDAICRRFEKLYGLLMTGSSLDEFLAAAR